MMQSTARSLVALLAAALTFGLFAAGCGNGIEGEQIAEVALQAPSTENVVELQLPEAPQKQGQNHTIRLESTGENALQIETAEVVKAPDRLLHRGTEELGACNYDASNPPRNGDCEEGQYCDPNSGGPDQGSCYEATVPETPIEVRTGETKEFRFFLAADSESQTLDCPEPGDDVPEDLQENYCGEFRLETNANTSNNIFDEGDATFYFQRDASKSGQIAITKQNLTFEGLEPEASVSKQFGVQNNGEGALTITGLEVQRHSELINLDPGNTPLEIPAGGSETFTITVAIPADYDMSNLESRDFVIVDSSAKNASPTGETVTLNLGQGAGFGPALQFSKPAFSFDGSGTDTVTVENTGQKTLELTNATFRPSELADVYNISFAGEQTGTNLGSADGIPAGESADLEIEYTGDGGDVGQLRIEHNDEALFGQSSLMLLADQTGSVGDVVPDSVTFQFSTESSRRIALRNRGSEELTVSQMWGNGMPPTEVSIDGISDGDTLAPGEVAFGEVNFLGGDSQQPKYPAVNFAPDALEPTMQQNGNLNVNMLPSEEADRSATITSEADVDSDNIDGATDVGEVVRLEIEGDINDGDAISWAVVDRPDGSRFFSAHEGDHFFVRPDTTGEYVIGAIVTGGGLEIQPTYTLRARSSSN